MKQQTVPIYYQDAYLFEMSARVIAQEGMIVAVDRTILFPGGGGQQRDEGSLGGYPIQDAWWAGEVIYYSLGERPVFREGDVVMLKVKQQSRERMMRLHSASHIVAYMLEQKTGCGMDAFLGTQITPHKARLDYRSSISFASECAGIEEMVNAFILEEYPIFHFQSKKFSGKYRWICDSMEYFCCGLHPSNTAQIGPISLQRKTIGKEKERLTITLQRE